MADPSAPYAPLQAPCVVLSTLENVAVAPLDAVPPKKTPLTTVFPAKAVIRNVTWPLMFQTTYSPALKLDTVRLSSKALLAASSTSIRSLRTLPPSQSRQYSAI